MLQLLVEASFRNKTKRHPQNVLDLRTPAGGGAKLWIEITRLLHRQRLEEVSRFTAGKLLEGILVWRSAEQSQWARGSECLISTSLRRGA
jgi:hypothetical protein